MEKQKELDRLTKELVKQMTGKEVEDTQEADYQISYYYLNKAMDYTHCCTELKDKTGYNNIDDFDPSWIHYINGNKKTL